MDFDDAAAFAGAPEEEPSEEEVEAAMKAVQDLKDENASLKEQLAQMKKQPAAPSAHSRFNSNPKQEGDARTRLGKYLNSI